MNNNLLNLKTGVAGLLAAVALTWFVAPAGASLVTLTSSPFSLGYGYQANWDTGEITASYPAAGSNSPTTLGSFSFAPTVSGTGFSGSGTTFLNRVLGDGAFGVSRSADSNTFSVSITGSYNDVLPPEASNPQLTLNIESISIYAIKASSYGVTTLQFHETTSGDTALDAPVTLNEESDSAIGLSPFRTAANWVQLVSNPADSAVSGLTSTRTFNLGSGTFNGVDGFEIQGTVSLTYEIPEPASVTLLGLGAVAALGRRRR